MIRLQERRLLTGNRGPAVAVKRISRALALRLSRRSFQLAQEPNSVISAMTSHELIDAQFDRAVEIVQSLPTTGPIQTDYEEKLLMYRQVTLRHSLCLNRALTLAFCSLFKQGI